MGGGLGGRVMQTALESAWSRQPSMQSVLAFGPGCGYRVVSGAGMMEGGRDRKGQPHLQGKGSVLRTAMAWQPVAGPLGAGSSHIHTDTIRVRLSVRELL